MFVVRLLLFFVLLYNTEASLAENGGDYDWYHTTTSIPDTTSIGTKGLELFAVKNKYRYSVSPGEATNTPISKSIRMYSGETTIKPIAGDDDKPTNHTAINDSYSVTNEREYSRNTTAPDFRYNRTADDSETTTVKIAHDSYRGSVGAITLENGILTAYLPETSSAEEKTTTEAATTPKTPFDWWSYKYGSTTAKSRYYNHNHNPYVIPYRPYRPYSFDPITTTTPNYWYPTTAKDSETAQLTTTKDFWYALKPNPKAQPAVKTKPHRRWREYSSTTPKPRTTAVTRATTTTDSWYDTTTKPSPWDRRWREYSSTIPTPEYNTRYPRTNAVTRATTTTDTYKYNTNKPTDTWYPTTTTDTYKYNTDKTTDTTDQANRTTPASPCKSCNPVNISNSSINTNYYGQLVDLLKKIAGNILPSTINIAPNSNLTHLTVASGNGNTFIYVNN